MRTEDSRGIPEGERTRGGAPRLYLSTPLTDLWTICGKQTQSSSAKDENAKLRPDLPPWRYRRINRCKKTLVKSILSLGGWEIANSISLRSFSLRLIAVHGTYSRDGTHGESCSLSGLKNKKKKKKAENLWTLKIVEESQKRRNQRRGSLNSVYPHLWLNREPPICRPNFKQPR